MVWRGEAWQGAAWQGKVKFADTKGGPMVVKRKRTNATVVEIDDEGTDIDQCDTADGAIVVEVSAPQYSAVLRISRKERLRWENI